MALSYPEAVSLLADERGVKPGLERTRALLEALGDPAAGMRGVLVAGTNGKGSVCAIVDSICRASGLRTVMLTNPHLRSYCERVVINGVDIEEPYFAGLVEEVLAAAARTRGGSEEPTQFEVLTAVGLLACARERAEVVVCEVGLGGRLDSTNVLDLGVAAITNIALDHQAYLGSSIPEIAAEKAGIIKPGNDVVTATEGAALDVVRARCDAVGARLTALGAELVATGRDLGHAGIELKASVGAGTRYRLRLPLRGGHQIANAAVAVGVCERLRARGVPVDPAAVASGAAGVRWAGRMHWFEGSPAVLLDGAHNPAGMAAFVRSATELCARRPVVALFAAMADKDAQLMVRALRGLTPRAVMTAPDTDRAAPPERLAAIWGEGALVGGSVSAALDIARGQAGPGGVVAVCGSLYLVGEVLAELEAE